MKRRKGQGSVCRVGNLWHAYGPEHRVGGKRVRQYVGPAPTQWGTTRLLARWLESRERKVYDG